MDEKISTPWLKLLPAWVRTRIEHRPHLIKALSNTGWLFGEQTIRILVGLIVSVWIARYLGPNEFGLLNYAIAFVALFGAIAGLGLNNIVVRDLVREPQSAEDILGSTFVMLFLGGSLACVLAILSIHYARPDDSLSKLMVLLLSFAMLMKSIEAVKFWFESQVQSKYTVWVESSAYLIFSGVKGVLILTQASLIAFVWVLLAEGMVAAAGLMAMYTWRGGRPMRWRFHLGRAKTMLNESWPLVLSGLATMIYMRIDQIMLGQMLGDGSVGIYSAAVRISEAWYFIPAAIVASVFPAIIEAKKESDSLYEQRLQRLYELMIVFSLAVAIPMTFLSDTLISLIFGEAYEEAGTVLAIHIWTSVFVFLGIASGKWFVVEGLTKLAFKRNLYGAILNVVLNLVFIPVWGAVGAAVATLLSVSVAAYFSDLFSAPTRKVFMQKTKSILGIYRVLQSAFHGKTE